MELLIIPYRFQTDDGTEAEFSVELDPETLQLPEPGPDLPDWARLDFHQCPMCPLDSGESPYCPAAAHLH